MRKVLLVVLTMLLVAAAYAAMPIHAAWRIREAVRTADTATLKARVDWPNVRQSLKASLAEAREMLGELADAAGEPRPGLWQRIKVAALPYLTDPLVQRYVTPEGVPRLYAWRQVWRKRIGSPEDRSPRLLGGTWLAGTSLDRGMTLLARVQRARFVSPTRFEVEMADSIRPGRRWMAALELRGLAWHLTEVHIRSEKLATISGRTL
ncbi:MAG: DUF2939 domain-containing protein [Hyphomicrobiaceae bacterium]|nr:DUF2939 domain-containing protein [Hyphomicrobiaceae bacterium]